MEIPRLFISSLPAIYAKVNRRIFVNRDVYKRQNVEFVIVDGALKIAPAESIVVKIAGNTKTVTYNGEVQSVEGYTCLLYTSRCV